MKKNYCADTIEKRCNPMERIVPMERMTSTIGIMRFVIGFVEITILVEIEFYTTGPCKNIRIF